MAVKLVVEIQQLILVPVCYGNKKLNLSPREMMQQRAFFDWTKI